MTTDLVTWLRQQLDEDERVASDADGAYIYFDAIDDEARDFYLERDLPKLALAEVDAKRRILDFLRVEQIDVSLPGRPPEFVPGRVPPIAHPVLRMLALPYADRPGYRDEWRP